VQLRSRGRRERRRIARVHTRRDAVVVFDHAHHGRTNLTMTMTAKNMPYKQRSAVRRRGLPAPMSYLFRESLPITGAHVAARCLCRLNPKQSSGARSFGTAQTLVDT
jgi:4-aminobutyrate aminotransferase-like enzyme